MKIELTPYPAPAIRTNEWILDIKFMFGDADGYETRSYVFLTEDKFIEAYEFFDKCLKFKRKYHNLFIDLWDRGEPKYNQVESDEAITLRYMGYNYSDNYIAEIVEKNKTLQKDVEEFFGDCDIVSQVAEKAGIFFDDADIPYDIHCDCYASIDCIADTYYYNETGEKFKINII